MSYFSDVLEQKFASIPDEDPFWKDENPDQRRSNYDFCLKIEVFPGAGKADVFRYLNGEESYSAEQQSRLIDLCIAQDTVHVSLDLATHFLQSQGISASAVAFADNHFYIADKDKTFIPNDGNCFFHCLDYLRRQQTPSVGGDAVDGPVIDQLA